MEDPLQKYRNNFYIRIASLLQANQKLFDSKYFSKEGGFRRNYLTKGKREQLLEKLTAGESTKALSETINYIKSYYISNDNIGELADIYANECYQHQKLKDEEENMKQEESKRIQEEEKRRIKKEANDDALQKLSKTTNRYRDRIEKQNSKIDSLQDELSKQSKHNKIVERSLIEESLIRKAMNSKMYTKTKPEILDWISKQKEVTDYGLVFDLDQLSNRILRSGIEQIARDNRINKNLASNANIIREKLNNIPPELEQRIDEAEEQNRETIQQKHIRKWILPIERPNVVKAYQNGGYNPRLFRGAYNIRMNQ